MYVLLYQFVNFSSASLDHENPVITGNHTHIIHRIDNGATSAIVIWEEPVATDNSGLQTLTSSHTPGLLLPVGITEVTYTSTDPSGNTAMYTFTVTIQCKQCPRTKSILSLIYTFLLNLTCTCFVGSQRTKFTCT